MESWLREARHKGSLTSDGRSGFAACGSSVNGLLSDSVQLFNADCESSSESIGEHALRVRAAGPLASRSRNFCRDVWKYYTPPILTLRASLDCAAGICKNMQVLFLPQESTAWEPLSSGFRVEVLPHYPPNNR